MRERYKEKNKYLDFFKMKEKRKNIFSNPGRVEILKKVFRVEEKSWR